MNIRNTPLLFLTFLLLTFCETKEQNEVASFQTTFEASKGIETATYFETIGYYMELAKEFPEINIQTIGETDSGHPLHIVTFNADGDFNFQRIGDTKAVILINNGIHPGESDGIDATMLLYRDLALNKIESPENVILATIPIYNVGGALNRNTSSRANQNGPKSYGFRGNARNYDLNRDFIKADTKNANTFASIFHLVNPDIFIDNHVSNGADYQYTLTHLFTQHNKLGGALGQYLHTELMPKLEDKLRDSGWPITPYVNVFNKVPESGFSQFMDYPRYSTGYSTLWNTLGMMVETHMLKPYKQRVEGTYELMKHMVALADIDHQKIKELRKKAFEKNQERRTYALNWQIDTTKTSTLTFLGYEADTLISEVTGFQRLKYDRNRPFIKEVAYQNYYKPLDTIEIPEAYIVKKSWRNIIDRMVSNNIDFFELKQDTVLNVQAYKITSFQTRQNAYEGHYLHYNTQIGSTTKTVKFTQGDFVIPTNQRGIRYLMETLEPEAPDSFFNWNFFDTVLQQKEGFSPYVFEDVALKMLHENQTLRDSFLMKKENDEVFAQNWYAQLDWVFKRSKHYEDAHMQYPVYRILKGSKASELLKILE